MPDIAMCHDDECPGRFKCFRHEASGTVPHADGQVYAGFRHGKSSYNGEGWIDDWRCRDFIHVLKPKTAPQVL
jgi:hypothetical protein